MVTLWACVPTSKLCPGMAVGIPLVAPVDVSIVYAVRVLAPTPATTYRNPPVMTEEWGWTSAVTGEPVAAGFMAARLPS